MVYVLNRQGTPLMPCSECRARHLIKQRRAEVVKRTPFTIRLKYEVSDTVQPVVLGIDAGYSRIGISASTKEKVLFECEHATRNDVPKLLEERHSLRNGRRIRRLRFREPRFRNRRIPSGWIAPSVRVRIGEHMRMVELVRSILPVSEIVVETASFDIERIRRAKDAEERVLSGNDYRNIREFVLWRDRHRCTVCHGNSGDPVLEVHHIVRRSDGGPDSPDNLAVMCRTCHRAFHEGKAAANIRRASFRSNAFMGIMRWGFYGRLKEKYPDQVKMTFGYITKATRFRYGLDKSPATEARCIAGHPEAATDGNLWKSLKRRCHNRMIHKICPSKGGIRKSNQCPRKVYGYGLFDRVKVGNREGYIHGRRSAGYFDVRTPDGKQISAGISYRKIALAERAGNLMMYRSTEQDKKEESGTAVI